MTADKLPCSRGGVEQLCLETPLENREALSGSATRRLGVTKITCPWGSRRIAETFPIVEPGCLGNAERNVGQMELESGMCQKVIALLDCNSWLSEGICQMIAAAES